MSLVTVCRVLGLLVLCLVGGSFGRSRLTVDKQDLNILTERNGSFMVNLTGSPDTDSNPMKISFTFQGGNENLLPPLPTITMSPNSTREVTVVTRDLAGHVDIVIKTDNNITNTDQAFVRVVVMKSETIEIVSIIIGWIYFVAWSVSFYPQIWDNYRRKSVIGLNFDFLALNIVGFSLYGTYNICLFWVDSIQADYKLKYPRGVIPVQANDVFFPIHAVLACAITLIQCFMYERGGQRVSKVCLAILGVIFVFVIIILILSGVKILPWLDFLNYCSYVKLGITLIKYVPQAFMNFRRKSTVGWSIGNIILDFTGGSLSILQMILIAYNNDDWSTIFGDPTKFGLGFFSVLFDIFFMLQHYVFYRGNLPHETLAGSNEQLANGVLEVEAEDPESPKL